MIINKKYDVDEGCLVSHNILENMFISECVSVPRDIYKEIEKLSRLEEKQIPDDIDYQKVTNLASEARQKLEKIRPKTIAQASRISGVNPVDISVLTIYLKKEYGKNED